MPRKQSRISRQSSLSRPNQPEAPGLLPLLQFPKAGQVIAVDGGEELRTPYDGCVLVMPNHRAVRGQRAFRLARRVPES